MVPLTKSQGVTEVGLIHSLETLNIVKMCADTLSRDIAQDKQNCGLLTFIPSWC